MWAQSGERLAGSPLRCSFLCLLLLVLPVPADIPLAVVAPLDLIRATTPVAIHEEILAAIRVEDHRVHATAQVHATALGHAVIRVRAGAQDHREARVSVRLVPVVEATGLVPDPGDLDVTTVLVRRVRTTAARLIGRGGIGPEVLTLAGVPLAPIEPTIVQLAMTGIRVTIGICAMIGIRETIVRPGLRTREVTGTETIAASRAVLIVRLKGDGIGVNLDRARRAGNKAIGAVGLNPVRLLSHHEINSATQLDSKVGRVISISSGQRPVATEFERFAPMVLPCKRHLIVPSTPLRVLGPLVNQSHLGGSVRLTNNLDNGSELV